MSLEFILWFIAWLIITEILFILALKKEFTDEDDWIKGKIACMFLALLFCSIQFLIVFGGNQNTFIANYFNLVYEAIILGAIGLFFYLNKKIVKYYESK